MPIATISVNFASLAEVQAGTATAKSINPSNLKSALQSGLGLYDLSVGKGTFRSSGGTPALSAVGPGNGASTLVIDDATLGALLSIRHDNQSSGGIGTRARISGSGSDYGLQITAETGLGIYFSVNGSSTPVAYINPTGYLGVNKTTGIDYHIDVNGDVRATNFRGSGKFLTDVLVLTGGVINIAVPGTGALGTINNINDAYALAGTLLLDSTARININVAPGVYAYSDYLVLSHPQGDKIFVNGVTVPFYTDGYNATSTTPVYSTKWGRMATDVDSGYIRYQTNLAEGEASVPAQGLYSNTYLESTLVYSNDVSHPSVGDYIQISAVSGRDVRALTGFTQFSTANGNLCAFATSLSTPGGRSGWTYIPSPIRNNLNGADTLINWPVLATVFRASSSWSEVQIAQNTGSSKEPGFAFSGRWPWTSSGNASGSYIAFIGTPESWRGTHFTQSIHDSTDGKYARLEFSDGVATDNWLNVGDIIYALGQSRSVIMTSTTQAYCTASTAFFIGEYGGGIAPRTGYGSGNKSVSGIPFLVKTCFEKYRGIHRVGAVDTANRRCTIQVGTSKFDSKAYADGYPRDFTPPLPKWGIQSVGKVLSLPGTFSGTTKDQGFRHRVVNTFPSGEYGIIVTSALARLSGMAFTGVGTGTTNQGLFLGYDPRTGSTQPASLTIDSCGFFNVYYPILVINSATLNFNYSCISSFKNTWFTFSSLAANSLMNIQSCTLNGASNYQTFYGNKLSFNITNFTIHGCSYAIFRDSTIDGLQMFDSTAVNYPIFSGLVGPQFGSSEILRGYFYPLYCTHVYGQGVFDSTNDPNFSGIGFTGCEFHYDTVTTLVLVNDSQEYRIGTSYITSQGIYDSPVGVAGATVFFLRSNASVRLTGKNFFTTPGGLTFRIFAGSSVIGRGTASGTLIFGPSAGLYLDSEISTRGTVFYFHNAEFAILNEVTGSTFTQVDVTGSLFSGSWVADLQGGTFNSGNANTLTLIARRY